MRLLISDLDLRKMATAYIEDGKLIKWRYYNDDITHMDRILHEKCLAKESVTEREFSYIMTFDNVVIVGKNTVRFHRFSGLATKK